MQRVNAEPVGQVANRSPFWARRLAESALDEIGQKVLAGGRLSFEDGVRLYRCTDLNAVGHLANVVRERLNGNRAYFVRNQHLNYTNVCCKQCRFCSFYSRETGPKPYTLTVNEVRGRLRRHAEQPLSEVHIVGGINLELPYAYYLDLIRAVKEERPDVHVKAFTMVEIDQIQQVSGKPLEETLLELKSVGLGSLPGGGAEILSERLHELLHPAKLGPERWLEIARTAHRVGLKSTATMLYGHEETIEERVQHLVRLRGLQDETGGLQCLVPLSFHPVNTALSAIPGPSGVDDLMNLAVPRLMLDNVPHIKSFWIMTSAPVSQLALWYGADDLDGTIQEYEVTRDPQKDTQQALTREQLLSLIREAGRQPVERDALYGVVERC